MSKPMAVSLPCVLLLLDVWPLGRLQDRAQLVARLVEKVPFLALSAVVAIVTFGAQDKSGAMVSAETIGLVQRLLNAVRTAGFYLWKTVWPAELVPYYPFEFERPIASHVLAIGFFASATALAVVAWRRGRRSWMVAWLVYLAILAPVVGLVQVGGQAAADRYTYTSTVIVFLLTGAGFLALASRFNSEGSRRQTLSRIVPVLVPAIAICAALGVVTHRQVAVWRTSETMWKSVITAFPGKVPQAHNNLGVFYHQRQALGEAAEQYRAAIGIYPRHSGAHNNLGLTLQEQRRLDEAEKEFVIALAIDPKQGHAHVNLAMNFFLKGNVAKARAHRAAAESLGLHVSQRLRRALDGPP
jgi:hypothetical protein